LEEIIESTTTSCSVFFRIKSSRNCVAVEVSVTSNDDDDDDDDEDNGDNGIDGRRLAAVVCMTPLPERVYDRGTNAKIGVAGMAIPTTRRTNTFCFMLVMRLDESLDGSDTATTRAAAHPKW
jgi:hypothetical protein